jgi:hypothetical protein
MPENMNHPGAIAESVGGAHSAKSSSVVKISINCRLKPTVCGRMEANIGRRSPWPALLAADAFEEYGR